jgi:hypothetical protein
VLDADRHNVDKQAHHAAVRLTLSLSLCPFWSSFFVQNNNPQYADLGKYGTFELDISADEGTMTWNSDLAHIDELATELNITMGIPALNYHLHSFWALPDVNYAIGGTLCGAPITGGHYDPFFAVRVKK